MPINQKICSLEIKKLKSLEDVDISFEGNNLTAIMGENGVGKSTILHALSCLYQTETGAGETNYFTRFFKRVGGCNWTGSKMEAHFKVNGLSKDIEYGKEGDRWKPRLRKRLKRNTYYIGIDSCVPSIEKESIGKTSYSMVNGNTVLKKQDILNAASDIMGRTYLDYSLRKCGAHTYKNVVINTGTDYTSLSMGAGEQRIFTILETLFTATEYSLILIDELDLTMHTIALRKLIHIMNKVAQEKNLQIVFTSHREEILDEKNINFRHIWKASTDGKTSCLNHTTPECILRLNGKITKDYEVYVEDSLASAIIKSVLRDLNIIDYVDVIEFGDAANAFSVGAGLYVKKALSDNILIVTDGDVFRTEEDRKKIMQKRFSGNETDKETNRDYILSRIKQLNLPENEHPEHFIWQILKSKNGKLSEKAKRITPVGDKHHYIYDIFLLQGESKDVFYKNLIDEVKGGDEWDKYVKDVVEWAKNVKLNLGIL